MFNKHKLFLNNEQPPNKRMHIVDFVYASCGLSIIFQTNCKYRRSTERFNSKQTVSFLWILQLTLVYRIHRDALSKNKIACRTHADETIIENVSDINRIFISKNNIIKCTCLYSTTHLRPSIYSHRLDIRPSVSPSPFLVCSIS